MGRRQRRRDTAEELPSGTERKSAAPTPSGRYTPPATTQQRVRPLLHKVVGGIELLAGVAIIVINYLDYSLTILPGGHNEGYFLLGLLLAAGSMWWFGALDRPPSADEIRRQYRNREAGHG